MRIMQNITLAGILVVGITAIVLSTKPCQPFSGPTPAPIPALPLLSIATPAPKPVPQPVPKPIFPQLAAFTATWCGPCQRAKPEVDRIEKAGLADVVRIDIEKQPDTAHQYQVFNVPTFILYRGGKEALRTHDIRKIKAALQE